VSRDGSVPTAIIASHFDHEAEAESAVAIFDSYIVNTEIRRMLCRTIATRTRSAYEAGKHAAFDAIGAACPLLRTEGRKP